MLPHLTFRVFCATLAASLLGAAASAQSFDVLETRLADHPSLVALTYQADANRERSVAATALPDPVVSLGVNNFPVFDPSFSSYLPTNKAVGISQSFPSRAGRQARSDEAQAMAEQIDRVRAAQCATLRAELIALLHDKTRIARQRDLARVRSDKYDELTRVFEAEIDAGRPAVFRLAEIDIERADVARVLVDLQRDEAGIDARLIDLVGIVPETEAPAIAPIEWSGQAPDFHAVLVADSAIEIANSSVDGAEAAWKPNWGAQLTYQQRESGAMFAGDDWVSGMVTFTVPLWSRRSQEPRLRAAQADRASAKMRYQASARSAAARYAAEAASWTAAKEAIIVLSDNIIAVEDAVASQLNLYESGTGSYAPIVDGDISILKLRADIAAEEARMAGAAARMNALLVQP